MPDVIPFPSAPRPSAPVERLQEITTYGAVGPLSVALVRRNDAMAGLIHIVVIGSPAIGVEVVATLSDDARGRVMADLTGPAVVRSLELAETAFACRPEAC